MDDTRRHGWRHYFFDRGDVMDAIGAHRAPPFPAAAGAALQVVGAQQLPHDNAVPRPVPDAGKADASADGDNAETLAHPDSGKTARDAARLHELKARDREVRAHERAHLAAAGAHANGGASYTYETGPDGRRYAIGGEVQIDTAPVPGDPAATLAKATQIQRAALAPAEPSAQDRRVAADAAAMAATARAELAQLRAERASDAYSADTGKTAPVIEAVA